jgi:hypothetical protein
VVCDVEFGATRYSGVFHVLPSNVPLILGMTFLEDMQPSIDWASRKVFIAGKSI